MYPSLSPLYALFWAIDPCLPVIKLDPHPHQDLPRTSSRTQPEKKNAARNTVSPCFWWRRVPVTRPQVEILIWTNHPKHGWKSRSITETTNYKISVPNFGWVSLCIKSRCACLVNHVCQNWWVFMSPCHPPELYMINFWRNNLFHPFQPLRAPSHNGLNQQFPLVDILHMALTLPWSDQPKKIFNNLWSAEGKLGETNMFLDQFLEHFYGFELED